VSDALLEAADMLLPIGTFAETSGTYVNVEGTWQSFGGVASPVGEARPAWKVLRVLGNLVEADGFDYVTSEDVLEACRAAIDIATPESPRAGKAKGKDDPADDIDTPIYSVDGLVRRARALQLTPAARRATGEGES
jgi:NADH-quinone oxidoreductase subunit G